MLIKTLIFIYFLSSITLNILSLIKNLKQLKLKILTILYSICLNIYNKIYIKYAK